MMHLSLIYLWQLEKSARNYVGILNQTDSSLSSYIIHKNLWINNVLKKDHKRIN